MCDQQRLRSACAYTQSDQSLCSSLEYSMSVKLLTEHLSEVLSLKGGCTCSSESTLVKMPRLIFQPLLSMPSSDTMPLDRDEDHQGLLCLLLRQAFCEFQSRYPFYLRTEREKFSKFKNIYRKTGLTIILHFSAVVKYAVIGHYAAGQR